MENIHRFSKINCVNQFFSSTKYPDFPRVFFKVNLVSHRGKDGIWPKYLPLILLRGQQIYKKKCEPRTCENRRGTLNQPAYPGYGKVLYCNKTITIHFRWGFSMYSTYSSFLNCNSNIYKSNKSTTLNVLNFPLSTTPKSALVDVSPQTSLWKILCERTCFRQLSSSHSCLDKSVFIGWEINSA